MRRAATPERVEIYAAPLRLPLPNIRIPLRPSDDDVALGKAWLLKSPLLSSRKSPCNVRQRT
jgi:hypothetical protein